MALVLRYPASRGPSIFLDKSGKGRDLCQPPRLSLICRSSTETIESVRFETSCYRFCIVRMCFPRNCWLNTPPQYLIHSWNSKQWRRFLTFLFRKMYLRKQWKMDWEEWILVEYAISHNTSRRPCLIFCVVKILLSVCQPAMVKEQKEDRRASARRVGQTLWFF